MIWNNELDKELINLYKSDVGAVRKFSNKYNVGIGKIYYRLLCLGINRRSPKDIYGKNHHNWKGGRTITSNGYVLIRENKKYIPEHRLVIEKKLGRKLTKDEIPHHKNESFEERSNNDISNLELMTVTQHKRHHGKNGKRACVLRCR